MKQAKDSTHKIDRPDWDDFFMTLAFTMAQKSMDPSTKQGAVMIDNDKTILSVGYNSPPRGCHDHKIPLDRPDKYPYFAHAEENAITNAARHGIPLKGCTIYITGFPCSKCFRGIMNVGAKEVVYGPVGCVRCITDEDLNAISIMNYGMTAEEVDELWQFEKNEYGKVLIREYKGDVTDVIKRTISYLDRKCGIKIGE